jgi:hypothetical protein
MKKIFILSIAISLFYFLSISLNSQVTAKFDTIPIGKLTSINDLIKKTPEEAINKNEILLDLVINAPIQFGLDVISHNYSQIEPSKKAHFGYHLKIGILKFINDKDYLFENESVQQGMINEVLVSKNRNIGFEPTYYFKNNDNSNFLAMYFGIFKTFQQTIYTKQRTWEVNNEEDFFLVVEDKKTNNSGFSMNWGVDIYINNSLSIGFNYKQGFIKNNELVTVSESANKCNIDRRISAKAQINF